MIDTAHSQSPTQAENASATTTPNVEHSNDGTLDQLFALLASKRAPAEHRQHPSLIVDKLLVDSLLVGELSIAIQLLFSSSIQSSHSSHSAQLVHCEKPSNSNDNSISHEHEHAGSGDAGNSQSGTDSGSNDERDAVSKLGSAFLLAASINTETVDLLHQCFFEAHLEHPLVQVSLFAIFD